ncbi:hypothetical protein [Actinoplanes xinjiangensis]|uniref:hypothetical protein n=1 Tax=Actinoplanes xinjiangensis TaxID=512350 RepID=UPI00342BB8EE
MSRVWSSGRAAAAGLTVLVSAAAVAVSSPAQAAPATWSAANGAATATGTIEYRGVPGGRYADIVGAISVGKSDGQCYYLRYYIPADLLGRGFNSARLCDEGVLPVEAHPFLSLFGTFGFRFGLCRVAPGTADESLFADLGAHCVKI